ncbi:hypothetical protein SAMN04487906_2335 [Zhouia amylolytica]|uniref:Uncharacterized protein n=2 Tax=Zhouia amylolytica TaxID=376730 RepID=W2URQ3_9FLAO|nr:hypothetical protein [Zhouia amylolytica]ETN96830.1 hypothetical protein P278_02560 [Zhouia amylolytica AD3]MCQ0111177.1 hypothetical protein [Zhouia amylolytica]SFS95752.1 hypothetical protein SAMN04487906_2335 [Zhouia amylolytica]
MSAEKLNRMRKIISKLEDIKNTQESSIDKINHVITDLFQHPDPKLEKVMEDAHQRASDNVDMVREAINEYQERINALDKKVNPPAME